MLARLPYAAPIVANMFKTWPDLAGGLTVAMPVGVDTPGNWVEFVSAANAPATPFTVMVYRTSSGSLMRIEVGTGALGAEAVVASGSMPDDNFAVASAGAFPVHPTPIIPGGTRVVLRARGGGASTSANFRLVTILLPGRPSLEAILRGTPKLGSFYPGNPGWAQQSNNVVAGAAAWGLSASWTEIYGTVWNPSVETARCLITAIGFSGQNAAQEGQLNLAIGAAGAESQFAALPVGSSSDATAVSYFVLPFPLIWPGINDTPSGRISGKAAYSGGAANVYYPHFTCIKAGYYP